MQLESKRIAWYGPLWAHAGYATHSRELASRLLKLIPHLELWPTTKLPPNLDPHKRKLLKHIGDPTSGPIPDLVIQCTPTTPYRTRSKYSVLLTTIESLKPHFQIPLRMTLHDEIWVPCHWNKAIIPKWLKKRIPVLVIPEGVEPKDFHPINPPPKPFKNIKKLYTFHSDWSERKGINQLINAWIQASPSMPDAALLLITKHGMSTTPQAMLRFAKEINSMIPQGTSIRSWRIFPLLRTIPQQKLNQLYNQTYCGVLPTRGEAWSLFPCQLAATATPTITTNATGHLEYLNKKNSYLIKVQSTGPIFPDKKCAVEFYNHVNFPIASTQHLKKLFIWTYNHPDHVRKTGLRAFKDITSKWTWDKATHKIYDRITTILSLSPSKTTRPSPKQSTTNHPLNIMTPKQHHEINAHG